MASVERWGYAYDPGARGWNEGPVDDYCDECGQPLASDGACYGNHGDGMDED